MLGLPPPSIRGGLDDTSFAFGIERGVHNYSANRAVLTFIQTAMEESGREGAYRGEGYNAKELAERQLACIMRQFALEP